MKGKIGVCFEWRVEKHRAEVCTLKKNEGERLDPLDVD